MNQASQPTRRGGLPWGFCGMVVLVLLLEQGLFRDNLNFMDNVAVSWKYTGRNVHRKAKGQTILCFGDSMLKFGILPRIVSEVTGSKAHGLAIYSGSAPSSYYLFKRALDSGARPKTVLVDFARGILGDGPASQTRPYPWLDLINSQEAIDLILTSGDSELLGNLGIQSIFHSTRRREVIRSYILARLKEEPTNQRDITPALWRNWNTNAGGQANSKGEAFEDVVIPDSAPIKPGQWRCDPTNEVYLARFLDLAKSRGITVYWMLPPVTPGTLSQWVHSGDEGLYTKFVQQVAARYPNLVVLDARYSGYDQSLFVDGVHLDRDGASALSADVARAMREPKVTDGQPKESWVRLPNFKPQAPLAAIEDVGESRVALKQLWSTVK